MKKLILVSALFCFVSCSSKDQTPASKPLEKPLPPHQYQIGSTWDRVPVTQDFLNSQNSPALNALAYATARYDNSGAGHATVFYIGTFNGRHLAATNKHAVASPDTFSTLPSPCKEPYPALIDSITFNYNLNQQSTRAQCTHILGMWDNIDFAIIEITEYENVGYLASIAPMKFASTNQLKKGQEIMSIGYGFYQNEFLAPRAITGDFCKIFSSAPILLQDKTDLVSAWSFATNCDISVGDSGSAVIDTDIVGLVHGIFWSSQAWENPNLLSEQYLQNLYDNEHDGRIWGQLSYAIPTFKILEVLREWISTQDANHPDTKAIQAFLDAQ